MSSDEFVDRIQAVGWELRFVDSKNWSLPASERLTCYLIHEPDVGRYAVYTMDQMTPSLERAFQDLDSAMRYKAKLLFGTLELVHRLKSARK